nr:NADH dehydrogenase subunit 5 [Ipomoea batatas]
MGIFDMKHDYFNYIVSVKCWISRPWNLSVLRERHAKLLKKNPIFKLKVKFGNRTIPSVVYPRLMQPQMLCFRSALGYPAFTVGTRTGTPEVRPSRSSRTRERSHPSRTRTARETLDRGRSSALPTTSQSISRVLDAPFVLPKNEILAESEFAAPTITKLIPIPFSTSGLLPFPCKTALRTAIALRLDAARKQAYSFPRLYQSLHITLVPAGSVTADSLPPSSKAGKAKRLSEEFIVKFSLRKFSFYSSGEEAR